MKIVLVSTYELGRQPFGLASPAAWLRREGHQVVCADLSRQPLPVDAVRQAGLIGFYLPMHTATRLALRVIERIRGLNPPAQLCAFGLYAPMNEEILRASGVQTLLGGEYERALCDLAKGKPEAAGQAFVSLERLRFVTPDRRGLAPLAQYSRLRNRAENRVAGYTEASRGCKHRCRHCPVVPVYDGAFRIVPLDVVLADIRQQVAGGATHITFGDPDFFNGPGHAARLVETLRRELPEVTYDVTIKVEHLLRHRELLPLLKRTGCLFVTSAVESVDDDVLRRLDKGHTRAEFVEAIGLMREAGLPLAPTFVPFTPWTTWESYGDLLRALLELDLIDQVAPVQLAIRLLIPAGSRLLDLPEVRQSVGPFDPEALSYRWGNPDPSLDRLCTEIQMLVHRLERQDASRRAIFARIWERVHGCPPPDSFDRVSRAAIPYLTEPWYC